MSLIHIPLITTRVSLAAAILLGMLAMSGGAQDRVQFPEQIEDGLGPTRSESGEFKVNGPEAHTRGVYLEFAVAARADYLKLMHQDAKLKYPIIIDLWKAPGNRVKGYPVRHVIVVLPTHYSPTIRVALCESFRFEYLRKELVRFFLLEDALRRHPNAGDLVESRKDELVPEWLWAGVSEAIGFKTDGEPSELFGAVFQSGKIMELDEILKADPHQMTTLSRAIYRASAGGLVLTLLQQDGGAGRMRNFIAALAVTPQDQEALVRKYFPGIDESKNSLEKWWTLQAAELAKRPLLDILSIEETEERLARALIVSVLENRRAPGEEEGAEEGRRKRLPRIFGRRDDQPRQVELPVEQERVNYTLADYQNFIGRADFEDLIRANELELRQLSFRSFPLHRPLIKDYRTLITEMKEGKTKGIDERLAALGQARADLLSSGKMVQDVLNLYEATQIEQASGAFDEYRKIAERLKRTKPLRDDEVSKYLDRVQAEHE